LFGAPFFVLEFSLLTLGLYLPAVLLSFRRISLFPLVFSLFPLHFLLPLIFLSFGYISLFPLQFSPYALSLPFSVRVFFFSIRPSLPPPYIPLALFLHVFPRCSPRFTSSVVPFPLAFSFRSLKWRPRCHPPK
jgi:hypothetical protein